MDSKYDQRHTKVLNENTSEIDLPVVHESNSENDLTSSNSDFEQEKLLNVYVVQIQEVMNIFLLNP